MSAGEEENAKEKKETDAAEDTETIDPVTTDSATTDTEEAAVSAADMPAQSWERTAGGIKVSVEAPEGAFPENTRIAVTPVNGSSLKDTVSDAVDGEVLEVQAVDITFFDSEGREIEPAVPIRVVMTPAATEHAEEKTNVVHVDIAQQTAELIEQAAGTETDNSEVVFDADAFTIYAIVYSVDFEYEVNGKLFTSSMPGAEDMPLSEIVRGLVIVDETEIDTFVSKIASISSTNEEVAVVTENSEICVLKDGEAKIVISMQDGAKFEIDVKAEGVTSVEAENVAISTVNDLYLPTAAVAKAEAVHDEAAIEAVRAETSAVESGVKTIYQVFDISLENIEADRYEGFRVDLKLPESVDNRNLHLYHVHDGKVEELELDHVEAGEAAEAVEAVSFVTPSFSSFVLSYTVDFHYEIDGQSFDFSLLGGGFIAFSDLVKVLGIMEAVPETEEIEVPAFVENVETLAFSDPSLLWTGKVEHDTTVGTLKGENGLRCEYSAELTNEEIAAINAAEVTAVDWALISLKPFTSEETLTVTMKNGEVFTIRVTDAQEIHDAEKATIDVNKSYLICYEDNGVYYLLKNDGTVDSAHHPDYEGDPDAEHDFEHLNSTYAWTFNHIFKEQDVEHHLDKNYYLIRPIDDKSKTLSLNNTGEDLVQQGNNNVAVYPSDSGFILEGYHNIGTEEEHRYIHLGFSNGAFAGVDGDGVTVHIYEMDSLPTYDYTVRSADEIRGTVTVSDGTQQDVTDAGIVVAHYWDATSNHDKKNAGTITATPVTHMNQGQNKWLFDHWEQDGLPLDRDQYGATIAAETLPIPYNGSNLVAYFRQNPNYVVPASEKEPSSIEDMSGWLNELQNRNIPLDPSATKKTAEVYDAGNLDMAFCLDVSNSMYFPSKLVETTSANRANPMPIYQINNSGQGWSNQGWLDTNRDYDHPYYLIADASGTATVFKIYYKEGNWRAIDASRTGEWEQDTNNNWQKRYFIIGQEDFDTTWTKTINSDKKHPFGAGDNDNTAYVIYDAGDNGYNRFYYLNESFGNGSGDLNTIANLLKVAGAESPGVNVAYNSFNKNLGNQRQDFQPAEHLTVNLDYASGGGTRPDQAFNDAQSFSWTADYTLDDGGKLTATDRYVILVTDGAPQGKRDGETGNPDFIQIAKDAATSLKDSRHVKLITVGLSMENVTSGKEFLYDIADKDSMGNKMFYLAESASDLGNIFRKITKVLMEDAVVLGNIADTVSEGFYLVDKATGMPLKANDTIDIEGNLTTDESKIAGVVQPDGKTIVWTNQAIDSVAGWHGTVYVKAQEELLGGNGVNTNTGDATIVATKYHVGGKDVSFDTSLVRETLNLTANLPTPKVNVNELTFFNNETEWTVYLGEEVDPKEQLKAIYDSLVVEEVVNKDGSLHYTIGPNSIEERWDTAKGTEETFSLPELLERLIRKNSTMEERYINGSELNWDNFLTDIMADGITLPYHEYGLTDGGNIVITLEKTIAEGEEEDLITKSPHETTVTGDKVEQYILRIQYSPDYTVTPIGQGGQSTADFHTGTFGTMYQGHATGRETSTNTHVINVYNVPLDVYKTDGDDEPLAGATFKLYKEDATGATVSGLDSSKKYVEVAAATSGSDGIARLKHNGEDFGLVLGEKYYLIETAAPANYTKVSTVWEVEVQTEIGKFTDLDGEIIYSTITPDSESDPPVVAGNGVTDDMYPFNWDQGARIMLDGKDPVLVIAKGETEGTTTQITDRSFVSHKKAISFRHTVKNLAGGEVSIEVTKTWNGNDDQNRPSSVTITLYRVSEKGHQWGEGKVVPSTCTAEGNKQYRCSACGETKTEAVSEAGHTRGTAHRENEVEPTCTMAGGYDTVVRCTVCNAIISSEHTTIDALGHTPGEMVQENYVEPTYTSVGGYDQVVYCTRCGAEISREHVEIPMLVNPEHTVTINFYCLGDGRGGGFQNQRTLITRRSGTGIGDVTIQWNWNRNTSPNNARISAVEGLGASTYTTSVSGYYNGASQTLVISNITENLNVSVIIDNYNWAGTNGDLIGQMTFSGVQPNSNQVSTQSLRSAKAPRMLLRGLEDGASTLLQEENSGSGSADSESSMTQAQLTAYLNNVPDTATCKEGENHTYKERVDAYTISAPDWSYQIPTLPQYNEYGNEYKYYVVETPVTGYDITYAGQDDGMTGLANPEIINTPKTVEISVNKIWAFADPSFVTKVEGKEWPQGVTVHVVVYSKTGESEATPTSYEIDLTAEKPSHTFTLPEYSGENKIEYSAVETSVSGLEKDEFMTSITGDAENGYIITNTEIPRTKDFSFTKIWRVAVGETKLPWPSDKSITVKIKQDDAVYATYTISGTNLTVGTQITANGVTEGNKVKLVVIAADASTGYVFKLTGLPFGSPPDGYTYYVSEETVPGYQSPKYFKVVENSLSQAMGASRIEDGGTICNDQIGYELPSTGGAGTTLFTALGGFMTATAGAVLTLASHRRKRKAAEG